MKTTLKVLVLYFVFSFFVIACFSLNVYADSNNNVNIETKPDRYLFNVKNMVPGDWASRTITIQNRSENDFIYDVRAHFIDGSTNLYDEYLLKVWNSKEVLHEGKLKDFNGLSPRFLKSLHEEDLMLTLEFPSELGNEYQGLGFEFELKFVIEDYISNPNPEETPSNPQQPINPDTLDSPPVSGQILPSTSTNMFNFILGGAALLIAGAFILYLSRKRKLDMKV